MKLSQVYMSAKHCFLIFFATDTCTDVGHKVCPGCSTLLSTCAVIGI